MKVAKSERLVIGTFQVGVIDAKAVKKGVGKSESA
jgi:hypothetical protein